MAKNKKILSEIVRLYRFVFGILSNEKIETEGKICSNTLR